mmetsp:Transcript_27673/g.40089  ORF Transcript_27673/g.40089 Transcript_27673/m.40089 type:complete len:119 (+) Transcript_27673:250-606(+)
MGVAAPPKAAPSVVAAMAPHFHANGNALGAPAGPNGPYGASATAFDTLARSPRRWESLLSTTTKLATISPSIITVFPSKALQLFLVLDWKPESRLFPPCLHRHDQRSSLTLDGCKISP